MKSAQVKHHKHTLRSGKTYSHPIARSHNIRWTEEELNFLRENYKSKAYQQIADNLGKSIGGVHWQIYKHGLRKTGVSKPSSINWSLLTRSDIPYIAGFIDGEGTLTLNSSRNRVSPEVYVVNTDMKIIRWFKQIFGTEEYNKTRPPIGHKQTYGIGLSSFRDIFVFLQVIYPYLKVKRQQAKILMQFCKLRLKKIKVNGNASFDSRERELARKIRLLNKRGE